MNSENKLLRILFQKLRETSQTVSTAESCTGGLVAAALTDLAGSSRNFRGGIVVYHNELKESLLGLSSEVIEKHGAVSEEVVLAMALAAKQKFSSDISIATTGIAGPTGGTPSTPNGTVWIGISSSKLLRAERFQFTGDRSEIRRLAVEKSLELLILTVKE